MVLSDDSLRLDAVEALIENETFEEQFASLTRGLPDLERIVSRIHAKNCKVRDFLKVLEVGILLMAPRVTHIVPRLLRSFLVALVNLRTCPSLLKAKQSLDCYVPHQISRLTSRTSKPCTSLPARVCKMI